jgi:galactose-1-phosphate uridylyltransferase
LPELRKDPITGRWVIIATDRAKRPSDFVRQPVTPPQTAICPFDYGNEHKTPPEVLAYRTSGNRDQPGWRVRVVPNKFPVLGIEGELNRQGEGMYDKMNGIGAHEVIIEGPDHNQTLGSMSDKLIEEVLWAFKERVNDLKKDRRFRYIILFKNHGDAAGATLEHPHSQLIALPVIPKRVKAWVLRTTVRKLEKVLERPAYNFIVHSAPVQDGPLLHYHWHVEIIPKLTKVAGFEWATGFYINPTPPEESAKFLREAGLG